jgi:hypothetical protein
MVSPKPLSDFVPDVTLIAFPIPAVLAARRQNIFLARIAAASRQENGLVSGVEGQFRLKPELAPARSQFLRRFRRLFADAQSSAV